jgi:hypothetical protein
MHWIPSGGPKKPGPEVWILIVPCVVALLLYFFG